MTRIDDDTLSLHLEVALSGAASTLLAGLGDPDRRRRIAAVTDLARHLAQRLRCFDILTEDSAARSSSTPTLFPRDLGPLG
jgi:uridine phosphorylase